MSRKPVFNIGTNNNQLKTSTIPSPFWDTTEKKKSNVKPVLKQIWKWVKILLLIFFVVMGLWGCTQTMWDPQVKTNNNVGECLEFGFSAGTSGDFRYDLGSNGSLGYRPFDNFTMQYGPFYAWFVYPCAWISLQISYALRSAWGGLNVLLAIFVLLFIIRGLTLMITLRSSLQNEKMTEVQGKIAEINAKYKGLTDSFSKQRKAQETMELYKKHKIKPFAAFEQVMITLPIFMIIYRVVTITRPFKTTVLFNTWNFGTTPTSQIFSNNFIHGGWTYLLFLLIIIPVQFVSMKFPQIMAKKRNKSLSTPISAAGNKQTKKTKIIQTVFTGVMCLIVVFSAVGVGVYWLLSSLFTILQSYIVHLVIMKSRKKNGGLESKLEKMLNG